MSAARILVVDDDANMLLLMKYHLEKRGHSVVTAGDGAGAIETARREQFDLLLLDVMIPGLSGFEVCRLLRKDPAYRHTPILLVTARGRKEDFQEAESCGASEYVAKPFDPIRLPATVGEHLAARSEASE